MSNETTEQICARLKNNKARVEEIFKSMDSDIKELLAREFHAGGCVEYEMDSPEWHSGRDASVGISKASVRIWCEETKTKHYV